jgi:hypothetical protein
MCPNRSDRQWLRLKENAPEDFEKAVAVEKEIQAVKGFDDCYLHRSCKPLQSVEFKHNIGQVEMDWECGAGEACWR